MKSIKYNRNSRNRKYSKRRNKITRKGRKRNNKKYTKRRKSGSIKYKHNRIMKGGGKTKCQGYTNSLGAQSCPCDAYYFNVTFGSGPEGWYVNREFHPFAKTIERWEGLLGWSAVRSGQNMIQSMGNDGLATYTSGSPKWNDPNHRMCPYCYHYRKTSEMGGGGLPGTRKDTRILENVEQHLTQLHQSVMTYRNQNTNLQLYGKRPSRISDYSTCVQEGSIKIVYAHGNTIHSPFTLPPRIRVITLAGIGMRCAGQRIGAEAAQQLQEIYDNKSSIFQDDDMNPNLLTQAGQNLVNQFSDIMSPKLHLGSTIMNNITIRFLGGGCGGNTECEILCFNRQNNSVIGGIVGQLTGRCGESCWSNFIPIPFLGEERFTLEQLIHRSNPEIPCLYILNICRRLHTTVSEDEGEIVRGISRDTSAAGAPRHVRAIE